MASGPLSQLERDLDYPLDVPDVDGTYPLVDGVATARDRESQRWGLVDSGGGWIAPPTFRMAHAFSGEHFAIARDGQKLWGFADRAGAVVIDERFPEVDVFSEGLCAAKKGTKWGFVDPRGAWVIAPTYQRALAFHEGLAPVRVGKLWGYVDRTGAMVIEARFARAFCFENGRAQVVSEGHASRGRLVEHAKEPLRELRGTWGILGRDGAWIVSPRFEHSESQFGGMGTQDEDRLGRGAVMGVVVRRIEGCASFREGLAAVRVDGRWGYADAEGRIVVEPQFGWAKPFAKGVARVWRFHDPANPWGGGGHVDLIPRPA